MEMGLGYLRLPPAQFWAMTPKELETAMSCLSGDEATRPLTRVHMDDLLLQFPDEVKNG